MKKLLYFLVLVLVSFAAQSQVTTQYLGAGPKSMVNVRGHLVTDSLVSVAKDTFFVQTTLRAHKHIAAKDDSLYIWVPSTERWVNVGAARTKLNTADTATMLLNYKHWAQGYLKAPDIVGKVNYSDTAAMLLNYIVGPGYGLIKSGKFLRVDSINVATKDWVKFRVDSAIAQINLGPDSLVELLDVDPAALAHGMIPKYDTVTDKFLMVPDQTGAPGSGITSINGDAASTQSLATGTTGTDFAISTSSGVHNFNIPTTSSANRGLVTSAQHDLWNSVINKLNISDTTSAFSTFIVDGLYGLNKVGRFLKVDSNLITTRLWHQKSIDSLGALLATSGTSNTNAGAGFRVLKPGLQEIKTLFNGYAVNIDSTSNTDGLTFKADTTINGLTTKLDLYRILDSIPEYSIRNAVVSNFDTLLHFDGNDIIAKSIQIQLNGEKVFAIETDTTLLYNLEIGSSLFDDSAFVRTEQITDTSYRLIRHDQSADTIYVSLYNGDKGDISVLEGWTNWVINAGAVTNTHLAGGIAQSKITGLADSLLAKQKRLLWQDEGTGVGGVIDTVDFVGSGVTATRTHGKLTVSVSGGGGANEFLELKFKVGVTENAPEDGDSVFTYEAYISKKLNVFREGELQFDSSATSGYEYNVSTGVITFHPPLAEGERIIIQAYPTTDWTINGLFAPAGYDTDAQALFTNIEGDGGSLTTPQKDAINDFVVELKAASLFTTHFDFIHVMVGGSEAGSKYNLINPATYTITFQNGATYATTGVTTTSGSSQWIDPNYIMSAAGKAGTADYHIGVYNRTTAGVAGFAFGVTNGTSTLYGLTRAADNNSTFRQPNTGEGSFADATTGKGFYLMQTRPATAPVATVRKDGVQKIGAANNGNGLGLPTTYKLAFNAYNNQGTMQQFRTGELSIITAGKSFTDSELTDFETAIANLVTALGL